MKRANNVLELIGATPIVRLNRVVEEGAAQVWGKLEAVNPSGSVKDRIALAMVEAAEEQGLLNPGKAIPTLARCAEFNAMHVHDGNVSFPYLERF